MLMSECRHKVTGHRSVLSIGLLLFEALPGVIEAEEWKSSQASIAATFVRVLRRVER